MAACALRPESGTHVIDCCAAPGNKTTHLAGADCHEASPSSSSSEVAACPNSRKLCLHLQGLCWKQTLASRGLAGLRLSCRVHCQPQR